MFRYEIGAHILLKDREYINYDPIEVEILNKAPNMIKALICSEGWFKVGNVYWLHNNRWFSIARAGEER